MKKYDTRQFIKDTESLGVKLTEGQIRQFLLYYEMLAEWNERMNLTAITAYDDVMKKHFVDSVSLRKAFPLKDGTSLIDVGTGAGFPGLALGIAFPGLQITLLDSLKKRIVFLEEVIKSLELKNIQAVHGRAEDMAKPGLFREKYDLCVSRAVANLSALSEYCLPFVKVGGFFVSYKSDKISEEKKAAENAVLLLGGKFSEQISFTLPESTLCRTLVLIEKVKETPVKYPRKAGLPGKQPL